MCGVVGALAFGDLSKKEERVRQESAIFLTTELLQITQSRGKDATGISTLFADGNYIGLKMGISASEFIARFGGTKTDYDGYLSVWRKESSPAKITIGHCRKPSVGTTAAVDDNNNNHPIKVGNIVGVHNGTLTNHEIIFENLKCGRDGKVDSEAIFRLLSHVTNEGADPFTAQSIKETCKRISGQYACLAFNGNNPYQMAAFRDGRPLEVAILRPLKLVLIASDKDFLKTVLYRYNKMSQLYSTSPGFPLLKKADVDIEALADDSLYLFDVRNEIDKDTAIKDLYVTEKIPRSEKTWTVRTPATTTVNRALVSAANPTVPGATNATTTATSSQDAKTQTVTQKEKDRPGMAWNKKIAAFVPMSTKTEAEKFGSVLMDQDIRTVKSLQEDIAVSERENDDMEWNKDLRTYVKRSSKGKFLLAESDVPLDDMITDPAKIEEITVLAEPTVEKDTMVVDMHVIDPDIISKAAKATQEQQNFSNNAELADALEIKDIEAMKVMETYSLANRIKNFFFKSGFEAGFSACRKDAAVAVDTPIETYHRPMMERARNKLDANRRLILNLKTFARIIGVVGSDSGYKSANIAGTIKDVLRTGGEVDAAVLSKAFRPGDRMDIPIIDEIISEIAAQ